MVSSRENIEHPGIIHKIEDDRIWVKIQPQSSCGSCHSKSYCGMAEVAEKIVQAKLLENRSLKVGQEVIISLKKSLGYRALFLGYLLPFIIVLSALIITLAITGNEAAAAILSVLLVIPYYYILYQKRESIKSSFRFFIK